MVESLSDVFVTEVSVGSQHCIAVTSDGDVYSWGKNSVHEVNDTGDVVASPVLLQEVSGKGAFSLSCGSFEVHVQCHVV